ncbi:ribosome rescue protein RqcH [Nitrososphaera sp. AFS]|uniref:ribosome rescue protein RqcH n=1 Tax=Nitrososphaera sp. AFS TaxID=2301191 RepID=UPI00139228D5|nr:ribosome rescue protein RqcH [Nitrososphaera sp. AFS]NAL76778.1 fibronectin-binding domain-containing protein [Nitrososphaera sp. AFS]
MLELSGIEVRHLINEINSKLIPGYYVSGIVGITRDTFLFKLHHSVEPDVSLMLSVNGLWLTRFRFKQAEESDLLRYLRQEVERARIESIVQSGSERIIDLRFRHLDDRVVTIIVELFGNGNVILCNETMRILAVLNPIQVRHRILKKGLEYHPPPTRGADVLDLSFEQLKIMRDKTEPKNLDILRWLGRNLSIPRKFVEQIAERAKILAPDIGHISDDELARIYESILDLVAKLNNENLRAIIIEDEKGKARDAIIELTAGSQKSNSKSESIRTASFMDAVDEVLTNEITDRLGSVKTTEFDKQIAIIEHDIEEQNKAKEQVILKSTSIRKVASRLMSTVTDANNESLDNSSLREGLASDSADIVLVKGKKFLEVSGERVPLNGSSFAKISSLLFERAKELEKACGSIDVAKTKLYKQLENLRNRASAVQSKVRIGEQTSKEWYERYRWFITSEGLLSIGGRDATSNSAIIRKHLAENDLVFHAEVFGSPFFILKGAKQSENVDQSILEVAQATVSFSRAWKDGLSSADAYWVEPSQIKRGAPTGQFLPKGSFVIEGKRNYIKGIGINLAIGVSKASSHYVMVCGPSSAIKRRSEIYSQLAPGGLDPNALSKKVKSELVRVTLGILGIEKQNSDLLNYVKLLGLADITRTIPSGHSKIIITEKGKSEAVGSGI